ncbi:type II secretion system protein GspL [Brevundimonas aurantiaca]|jgi:general secretion pathway protein L|uniref:type II secretion system protein GspL n=1 Tax=Brevundimonas aurantiaca TaxID=74316 RepID=UPI0037C15933
MSQTRIVIIPPAASMPAPFLTFDEGGRVLQRGSLLLEDPQTTPDVRTVAVAPGADVLVRWLDLPVGGAAQVRAAARWALKDELAGDPERTVVAVAPAARGEETAPRLVAAVSAGLLEAWIDYLAALGVRPVAVTPDCLLAPPPSGDELVAAAFGGDTALRGEGFAATVQSDLVALIAGDRRLVRIEDAETLERWLAAAAVAPAVDLLSGQERKREPGRGDWRLAAALAAALLVSPLILTAAGGLRYQAAARDAERQTLALIEARLPEAAGAPDPVQEARRLIDVAPPPGGLAAVSAALFAAVEQVEGAELDSLSAGPGKGVRATLSYPAFSDLDAIRATLTASGLSMTDQSTVEDGGRVVSEVIIGGMQ